MTYKIILADSAFSDLESIKSFIGRDNPVAARKYVAKLFDRLDELAAFPHIGISISNPLFDYAQARYLICANHVAVYQVNELAKCVYVLRVLSHFQDWKDIVNKDILQKREVITGNSDLLIAKMNPSMAYDVYRNSQDEDNRKYVPDEVFGSLEEALGAVNQIIANYEKADGPFVYAVLRKSDNANLGYVQLAKAGEVWEIGYHIAKLYSGQGYATEAAGLFLQYLKDHTQIDEVFGIVLAANKASRRVLEKCGFETIFEGQGLYQGSKRKIVKTVKRW